jgi:hypothetical protein
LNVDPDFARLACPPPSAFGRHPLVELRTHALTHRILGAAPLRARNQNSTPAGDRSGNATPLRIATRSQAAMPN